MHPEQNILNKIPGFILFCFVFPHPDDKFNLTAAVSTVTFWHYIAMLVSFTYKDTDLMTSAHSQQRFFFVFFSFLLSSFPGNMIMHLVVSEPAPAPLPIISQQIEEWQFEPRGCRLFSHPFPESPEASRTFLLICGRLPVSKQPIAEEKNIFLGISWYFPAQPPPPPPLLYIIGKGCRFYQWKEHFADKHLHREEVVCILVFNKMIKDNIIAGLSNE